MASNRSTIFVRNLAWSCNESDLDAVFGKVGTVVESRVIRFKDEAAKSRGFGFVTFASAAEAARAVAELNGASLGGRELYVELSEPREPRFPQPVRAGGGGGGGFGERVASAFPQLHARGGLLPLRLPGLGRCLLSTLPAQQMPFALPTRAFSSAAHAQPAARLTRTLQLLKRVL